MGAVFAMFSGWYHWSPKIFALNYNMQLSNIQFWILFIGVKKMYSIYEISKRLYSEFSNKGSPGPEELLFLFFFFFNNIREEKKNIYKELRKKSGVYMLINNITKEFYIGSGLNLTKRMVSYYYYTNSDKLSGPGPQIVIIRAMKKYGLENFSLGILEFCKNDSKVCLNLEQNWLDKYKPKYNVLNVAGNSFSFAPKHSIDTIIGLKQKLNKENQLRTKFGTVTETKKTQKTKKY